MFKRMLSGIISLVIVLSAFPLGLAVSAGELLGDLNNDGNVGAVDYALAKRTVLGSYIADSRTLAAADINGDGAVSALDYALIKRQVLGTFRIDQIENSVPVSYAKKYTLDVQPSENYADSYGCELTDSANAQSSNYTDSAFIGVSSDFSVVVDLENDGKYLNRFAVSYLSVSEAGINVPRSITVYGSDNNSSWNELGNIPVTSYPEGKVVKYFLDINGEVNYRYIKFSFVRKTSWIFIDEVYVYANIIDASPFMQSDITNAYIEDKTSDADRLSEASKAFNGKVFDSKLGMSLISENCKYSISADEYDRRSGRSDTLLTDGAVTGRNFGDRVWVGISNSAGFTAEVDLDSVQTDICSFAVHCFERSEIDIKLPAYVDVSVSTDGKTYHTVGRSYAMLTVAENYSYRIIFKDLISARYVRFSFAEGYGYCWIEELEIYGNRATSENETEVYGDFGLAVSQTPVYWDYTYDYNTVQTLSNGAEYQILSDVSIDVEHYGDSNTSEEEGLLTDGITTSDTYCYNGYWNHFQAGGGRNIVIDLGKISSVSSYSVRFLHQSGWAITLPDNIKFALSENGEDWYLVESVNGISGDDASVVIFDSSLKNEYRARYAVIYMPVDVHIFIDEIEIKGRKNYTFGSSLSTSALEKYKLPIESPEHLGYLDDAPSVLGGAKDITLVYHNIDTTDEEYFLPYVAYLDANENIKDTMFDGYLFLPSTGSLPSGGRPYGTNVASDWEYLFNDLFAPDRSFAALNRTAETVKNELGRSELKLKVFATIPHMDDTLTEFGDINGDFVNEDLTSLETRVFVARYYAEKIIKEFEKQGYDNLELCGFYWFHEAISGGDVDTAKAVNADFDELGYPMFWIPYYQASGFSNWKEFGFDVACLQPNYAFSLSVDSTRLYHASNLAKRYGMCIELEIDSSCFSDIRFLRKYMDYLRGGVEYGYMNGALHMYYQGYNDFARACRSDDDIIRMIYDHTYRFIKGSLDVTPEASLETSISTNKNTFVSGSVNSSGTDTVYYQLSESPEHGTVSFAEDGSFVYYPNKGYKGKDCFKYRICNYLGLSEECTVNIQVG